LYRQPPCGQSFAESADLSEAPSAFAVESDAVLEDVSVDVAAAVSVLAGLALAAVSPAAGVDSAGGEP